MSRCVNNPSGCRVRQLCSRCGLEGGPSWSRGCKLSRGRGEAHFSATLAEGNCRIHVVEGSMLPVLRVNKQTRNWTGTLPTQQPSPNRSMSGRPLDEMRRHNPAEQSEINPPPAIINYRLDPHTATFKVGRHRGVKIERKNLGPVDGIPPTLYLGERLENL